MVLSEAYYPGWQARVDGERDVEIFPVYNLLRGVKVPAGHHTVVFQYRPLPFRIGAALSSVTLMALFAWACVLLYRHTESQKRLA